MGDSNKLGVGVQRLCIKEYAMRYGVHASTVRRWIKDGILEYEQPAGSGGKIFLKEVPNARTTR